MHQEVNHTDCGNFIPIDVAKGFCNMLKGNVVVDSPVCNRFEQVAKCRVCTRFAFPDEKGIGKCGGFCDESWTFAELKAVNCEKFQAR